MGLTSRSPPLFPSLPRRYRVEKELGSGSFGTVYLALDSVRKKQVALKVLRIDRLTETAITNLQLEFKAISSLRHARIAAAYDFGYSESGKVPFYTREYIHGVPLPPGPPTDPDPVRFLAPILDLLEALAYLHAHGVLHLDIHSGNLILAAERKRGSVLIDFGLARSPGGHTFPTAGGGITHAPPELLRGADRTPRTDVFLAGRLLHYRLTGRVGGAIRLMTELAGWTPKRVLALERIATKALQPDPDLRFSSAAELREAMEEALGGLRRRHAPGSPKQSAVGREREIEAIEAKLQLLTSGASGVLHFVGKPGLGKTRLLTEARIRAQIRGFEVVEVSGLQQVRGRSSLFRALKRTCAGPLGGGSWLRLLDPRHGGTPQERGRRSADAYFLADGKPLVLVLDDLEHADAESRALVEALSQSCVRRKRLRQAARGLVIFAASGSEDTVAIPGEGTWRLKPLGKRAARDVLRGFLAPLNPEDSLVNEAVHLAGGVPVSLLQMAAAIRQAHEREGSFPARASLQDLAPTALSHSTRWLPWKGLERRLIEVLTIVDRPVSAEDLCAGLPAELPAVQASLHLLQKSEVIVVLRWGRETLYQLNRFLQGREIAKEWPPRRAREVHERLATHLLARRRRSAWDEEYLARHLLASGKLEEGGQVALNATTCLRRQHLQDRALRLLRESILPEQSLQLRLRLAESLSLVASDMGDHLSALETLGPIFDFCAQHLDAEQATRFRRWLGVHYHRAGQVEKALQMFEDAQRGANPDRSMEDLVHIDSELAEIGTFQGRYEDAEAACRRGLARLRDVRGSAGFHARMAVMLRASLGHLEMRRMNLSSAREELEEALRLCGRCGNLQSRVVILNNLGIAANQTNDYARARQCFSEAERILLGVGERRGTIEISCNLAVIAAKLGERERAYVHLEEAVRLHREYPSARLDFFVSYTRGLVAILLGEARAAIAAFEEALPPGRKLRDNHLVQYGEVYLAEAHMLAANYRKGLRILESSGRRASAESTPLLFRMVHARKGFTEALLGLRARAQRSLALLDTVRRTPVELLEAWNGLFLGMGRSILGEAAGPTLDASLATFVKLGIQAGVQLARVTLLAAAVRCDSRGLLDRRRVTSLVQQLDFGNGAAHRFLAVAEPLARAEAAFALGDFDPAETLLEAASGAMVGSPFLELDWRIELLRARIAGQRREVETARCHLRRSLHARHQLLEHVPPAARDDFLAQPRFRALAEAELRWRNAPRASSGTDPLRPAAVYEGMVGLSSPMVRMFQLIAHAAHAELSTLICGETGTGKELVARAIHRQSARAKGPFLVLSCASLPAAVFESELFGSAAGAYTGADEDRTGLLEHVAGGTLLLDEIFQLPLEVQAKLLRVLDTGSYRRLGSNEERRADVRFLASTSLPPEEVLQSGRLRPDLYYRLRALEIRLPPLRERKEDILHLTRHFLEKHAQRLGRPAPEISTEAIAFLERHPWPGNIRELENMILRALVTLSGGHRINARDLKLSIAAASQPLFNEKLLESCDLKDLQSALEKQYLTQLFLRSKGDLKSLMTKLQVKRTWLYKWFRKLGLDLNELRERLGEE